MRPGEHQTLALETGTFDALFSARLEGWELRDTFYVAHEQGQTLYALLRRPLDQTVHSSVVQSSLGALDIDAGRIGSERRQATAGNRTIKWGVQEGGCSYEKGTGATFTNEGRFPANFVLVHSDKCSLVGKKRVKPSNGSGRAHQDNKTQSNQVYQGGWNPHGVEGNAGYVSSDGKEEVEDWKCEPGCPVEILDNQSGSLTRGSSGQRNATNGYGGNIAVGSKLTGFGDTGGASRFFYNATSTADLNDYLNALVRSTA